MADDAATDLAAARRRFGTEVGDAGFGDACGDEWSGEAGTAHAGIAVTGEGSSHVCAGGGIVELRRAARLGQGAVVAVDGGNREDAGVGCGILYRGRRAIVADRGDERDAAPGEDALTWYEYFVTRARSISGKVATGAFGEMMDVELVNDGPVTIILDSKNSI